MARCSHCKYGYRNVFKLCYTILVKWNYQGAIMPASHKIFTDPSVAISLFALLIAIAGFICTIFYNVDQNRRWDALNVGQVGIKDVGFIMWKEISKEEATSTEWGYKPTIFSHAENRLHTGKYRIPYELILVDPNSNVRIPGSNGFFTIPEASAEVERLSLNSDPKPEIRKHFQIQIDFQNKGATLASEMKTVGKMKEWGKETWIEVFNSKQGVSLAPSATCNVILEFTVPLQLEFPDVVKYEVEITYKDVHSKFQKHNLQIIYHSKMNYWVYGS